MRRRIGATTVGPVTTTRLPHSIATEIAVSNNSHMAAAVPAQPGASDYEIVRSPLPLSFSATSTVISPKSATIGASSAYWCSP